jgi:hypothetical protein
MNTTDTTVVERVSSVKRLRQSITGLCLRLSKKRGAVSHFDQFVLSQFAYDFEQVKKAYDSGDMATVKEFFEVHC